MQDKMSVGFDLVLITERMTPDELQEVLDVVWGKLRMDGFIVADHMADKDKGGVFKNFCKGKGCSFVEISTRYGVSILQKS